MDTRRLQLLLDSTNGVVAFANSRTDAWHRLGQSVGHVMTASEALAAATLNGWAVRKMRLQIPLEPVITNDGAVGFHFAWRNFTCSGGVVADPPRK
jgi:hypothetical protein